MRPPVCVLGLLVVTGCDKPASGASASPGAVSEPSSTLETEAGKRAPRLVLSACFVAFSACSSASSVEGTILSESLQEFDGESAKAVEVFVVAPGRTEDLAVRVTWAVRTEHSESEHPFGAVDLSVERNEIGATALTCGTGDPELPKLLNGDRVWRLPLSCSYTAQGQSGEDISASLWANGLLTRH